MNLTMQRSGASRRARSLVIAALAGVAALTAIAAPPADAKKKKPKGPTVTVMTRNMFLGADLGPGLDAGDLNEAIDGAGVILNELDSTKIEERVVPMAKEIKESKADLVGLQEVALWHDQTPSDFGAPPTGFGSEATNVRYDFLQLLLDELERIGGKYDVVAVQDEFEAELPANTDGSADHSAELDGRLKMRDVILARQGSKVKLGKVESANFTEANLFTPTIAGLIELPVQRGWISVEGKVQGGSGKASASKSKDYKFRFVNTHLEAFGEPTIREAQARELFAKGGPLKTGKQVILVGDINSGGPKDNITGDDPLAYDALIDFGMKNLGTRHTCCYSSLFDPDAPIDHTVDHVMAKPGLKQKDAFLTGDDPAERTPSGLAPSDHLGVVSKLVLK